MELTIYWWTDYGLLGLAMGQTQQTGSCEEIDVKALQDMYKKFILECPSGVLFLHEFKRFFGVDPTGDVSEYAENMFRAFDRNGVRKQILLILDYIIQNIKM